MKLVQAADVHRAFAAHRLKYGSDANAEQFSDAFIAGVNALADSVRPELIQLREQVALLRKGGSLPLMKDDGSGYDLDDPKHPTYRERMLENADLLRDQLRATPQTPDIQPDAGPSEEKEQR